MDASNYVNWDGDHITVRNSVGEPWSRNGFNPKEARELAARLIVLADEAEKPKREWVTGAVYAQDSDVRFLYRRNAVGWYGFMTGIYFEDDDEGITVEWLDSLARLIPETEV